MPYIYIIYSTLEFLSLRHAQRPPLSYPILNLKRRLIRTDNLLKFLYLPGIKPGIIRYLYKTLANLNMQSSNEVVEFVYYSCI